MTCAVCMYVCMQQAFALHCTSLPNTHLHSHTQKQHLFPGVGAKGLSIVCCKMQAQHHTHLTVCIFCTTQLALHNSATQQTCHHVVTPCCNRETDSRPGSNPLIACTGSSQPSGTWLLRERGEVTNTSSNSRKVTPPPTISSPVCSKAIPDCMQPDGPYTYV